MSADCMQVMRLDSDYSNKIYTRYQYVSFTLVCHMLHASHEVRHLLLPIPVGYKKNDSRYLYVSVTLIGCDW